jgi:hypothetical protein
VSKLETGSPFIKKGRRKEYFFLIWEMAGMRCLIIFSPMGESKS